jgi:hypothetical protein
MIREKSRLLLALACAVIFLGNAAWGEPIELKCRIISRQTTQSTRFLKRGPWSSLSVPKVG